MELELLTTFMINNYQVRLAGGQLQLRKPILLSVDDCQKSFIFGFSIFKQLQ